MTGAPDTRSEQNKGKKAFVTGITGQDGAYLTELLLSKGYEVHGLLRRSSSFNTKRIHHIYHNGVGDKLVLHHGDLSDSTNLNNLIQTIQPDEVYNLGAMSHVQVSFEMPEYTADVDALGCLRLLNAIRLANLPMCRFYQASTSELFGKVQQVPQKETTPFYPRSPYGIAKQFAYWTVVNYREAYNMFAVNGILFNHESPRRGPTFVTRKITRAVARIARGLQDTLYLGNLDAKRDWGHARDFVEGMWRMLQHETPEDFVLATGQCHTVREFVEAAFTRVSIPIVWCGERDTIHETGLHGGDVAAGVHTPRVLVRIDPTCFRPTEVDLLVGDASKAATLLGWRPNMLFNTLVEDMVDADLQLVDQGDFTN